MLTNQLYTELSKEDVIVHTGGCSVKSLESKALMMSVSLEHLQLTGGEPLLLAYSPGHTGGRR